MRPDQRARFEDALRAYDRGWSTNLELLHDLRQRIDRAIKFAEDDRALARAQRDMALAMLQPEGGAVGQSARPPAHGDSR